MREKLCQFVAHVISFINIYLPSPNLYYLIVFALSNYRYCDVSFFDVPKLGK
jgi:hypothetical protein